MNTFFPLFRLTLLILLTVLTSACQWVNRHDVNRTVVVAQQQHIKHCQAVGNISARTRHTIILPRKESKVAEELRELARNEALKLKADTIVAITPIDKGEQQFAAFNCSQ